MPWPAGFCSRTSAPVTRELSDGLPRSPDSGSGRRGPSDRGARKRRTSRRKSTLDQSRPTGMLQSLTTLSFLQGQLRIIQCVSAFAERLLSDFMAGSCHSQDVVIYCPWLRTLNKRGGVHSEQPRHTRGGSFKRRRRQAPRQVKSSNHDGRRSQMTTTMDLFWELFKTTGSPEAYLLYRETMDGPE